MNRKVKTILIILSVLLAVNLVVLAGVLIHKNANRQHETVKVPDNVITSEDLASIMDLTSDGYADSQPFSMTNILPGDSETRCYCIQVKRQYVNAVCFRTEIRDESGILSQGLNVRLRLPEHDEPLYEGKLADMPEKIRVELDADCTQLYYEVTVSLDKSAGNEYADQSINAEFTWWVEDEDFVGGKRPSSGLDDDKCTPWCFHSCPWCWLIPLIVLFLVLVTIILLCWSIYLANHRPQRSGGSGHGLLAAGLIGAFSAFGVLLIDKFGKGKK